MVQFDLLRILEIDVKTHQHLFPGISKSIEKTEEMAKDQKKKGDNQCGIILIVVMFFYLYIRMSKYVYIKYHKFTIYQLRAM